MTKLQNALEKYKNLEISRSELVKLANQELTIVKIQNPVRIHTDDVILLLRKYMEQKITKGDLVDWVNTIWFTDLYEYSTSQSDCIGSVMAKLEEADDDDEKISLVNIEKYINALKNNRELE